MNISLFIALFALALAPHSALAERQLAREEVLKIFTNVTFDGVELPENKHFVAYDAPDGSLDILRPDGKIEKGYLWYVNSRGQRCTASPKGDADRCFDVFQVSIDIYNQYWNGKHSHVLTNFRKGNALPSLDKKLQ